MMRSLFAGVAGLKTHQARMDVIGNNIANVNTTAYKKSSMTFSELMYQTSQSASGPNATTGKAGVNAKQIGLGVTTGAIRTSVTTPGAAQSTGDPFDLRINGDSFFVVNDGKSNFFTRDGSFYIDGAGNLATTANGFNVMGWQATDDGKITQGPVSALRVTSDKNMTYGAEATSKARVIGVVDRNDSNIASAAGKDVSINFYDGQGASYTAKFSMKRVGDGMAGQFTFELTDVVDSQNKSVMGTFPGITFGSLTKVADPRTLTLNGSMTAITDIKYTPTTGANAGVEQSIVAGTNYTMANDKDAIYAIAKAYGYEGKEADFLKLQVEDPTSTATPKTQISMETALATGYLGGGNSIVDAANKIACTGREFMGITVNYNTADGSFKNINGQAGTLTEMLKMGGNDRFKDIEIDFSASNQSEKGGTATVSGAPGGVGDNEPGKGRKLGAMEGIVLDQNGMIYLTYDNGMSRLVGQIAVAKFSNPSGLEKMGNNLYAATLNSGAFDGKGVDISASGDSMVSGQLEMSNVDLSSEFTEMITTQRGFQANSRIITVSDTMLEELVNLKR